MDRDIQFYSMKHMTTTDNMLYHCEEDELDIFLAQLCIGAFIVCLNPVNRVRDNQFKNFGFDFLPVPEYKDNTPEYDDVVEIIADRLLKENDIITVLWSGGIDSTCALAALISVCDDWKKRIRVIYTDTSVLEYPEFYEKFVKHIEDNRQVTEQELFADQIPQSLEDSLVTSGECGDQIFGSMVLANDPESMVKSYKDVMSWDELIANPKSAVHSIMGPHRNLIFQNPGSRIKKVFISYLEEQIEYCPFEVKTIFDLYWWLNYSLKWNLCVYRAIAKANVANPFPIDKWYPFYNAPELHQWSISHHNKKVREGGNWLTYKQPAKDYIYNMAGDEDYRDNKVKTASLSRPTRVNAGHMSVINSRGNWRPLVNMGYLETQQNINDQYLKSWTPFVDFVINR